ncbi:hypothetical protein [Silvibacterium acidisoli]|uniref:hypothetical protein n=1 Tax=Acidobacteriaceae bacterium ZG23-2 TaxID=2883246 RepID=UPI00406D1DB7
MFNHEESNPSIRAGRAIAITGVAAIVVVLAIVAYVMMNRHSGPVEGALTSVKLYLPEAPARPADSDLPAEDVPAGNKMLVLAEVTVHNVGKKPLTVQDFSGIVKSGDTDFQSFAAGPGDFQRLFSFYPDLLAQQKTSFPRHETIPPGGSQQGLVIFNYNLTENQWNEAQAFNVEVSFEETKETLELQPSAFPAHERIPNVIPPQPKTPAGTVHRARLGKLPGAAVAQPQP